MGILSDSLMRIADAQRALSNFDFDTKFKTMMERGASIRNEFGEIFDTIKESVSDFKVVMPFNDKKDKFAYSVKDGVLTVKVSSKNGSSTTTATIPESCDIDKLRYSVSKEKGELSIIIPKVKIDEKKLNEARKELWKKLADEKENYKKATQDIWREASKKLADEKENYKKATRDIWEKVTNSGTIGKIVDAAKVASETTPPKKSKNKTAKTKIVRDEKGRFVSQKKNC